MNMTKQEKMENLMGKLEKAFDEVGIFPEESDLKEFYYTVTDILCEYDQIKES